MKQSIRIRRIGPSGNKWQRYHYQKQSKIAKDWYKLVAAEVIAQGIKPFPDGSYPLRLTLICYFPTPGKAFDWTNLYPTAKMLEDGLRHAGIIIDDNRTRVKYGTLIPEVDPGELSGSSILTLSSINPWNPS